MSMNSFHSRNQRSAPTPRSVPAAPADDGLMRVDALLVQQGLVASRTQAQAALAAGRVRCGTDALTKASHRLAKDTRLELTPEDF